MIMHEGTNVSDFNNVLGLEVANNLLPMVGLAHCCIWSASYASEVFPQLWNSRKKIREFSVKQKALDCTN
jgi:hypothetical protein